MTKTEIQSKIEELMKLTRPRLTKLELNAAMQNLIDTSDSDYIEESDDLISQTQAFPAFVKDGCNTTIPEIAEKKECLNNCPDCKCIIDINKRVVTSEYHKPRSPKVKPYYKSFCNTCQKYQHPKTKEYTLDFRRVYYYFDEYERDVIREYKENRK